MTAALAIQINTIYSAHTHTHTHISITLNNNLSAPVDTGHSVWCSPNRSLLAPPSSLQADVHLSQTCKTRDHPHTFIRA
jgi:hypothetical protein